MENRIRLDDDNKLIVDAICETDGINHNVRIEGDYTISADDVNKLLAGWNDKHIVRTVHRQVYTFTNGFTEIFTTSEDAIKHFDEKIKEYKKDMQETNDKCKSVVDAVRKLYKLILDHNGNHHSSFFNKGSKIEIPDDVMEKIMKYVW